MKIQHLAMAFGLAALALVLGDAPTTFAQKKDKGPPSALVTPTISPLLPGAIQRGQAVDLVITGANLANPTGVSLGFAAKAEIEKDAKDNAKLKVRLEVPANTPIGWYPFRVATLKGASNLRVFCVDDLPQVVGDMNRSKATAQVVPVPCAVSGAVLAEQSDFYKFSVKAGQRLSFDCLAHRSGSTMDAQMSIYDTKSMREIAFDNDSPGCQTDPRITYTFKEAGDYLLEIKDVLNRGGVDFFYRIRIGDFPLATTPIPMAAKRGSKAKISFAGPAVKDVAPVEVAVPSDPAVSVIWVAPKGASGLYGWPVPLALSDHDEAVEKEPNNDAKKANRISVPGGVTGQFKQSDDLDCYVFSAKKGQKLAIEGNTLEYYSPTLLYMVLKNAKTGAEVAKSNPQVPPPADQRIDFTAADDGDYVLEVQHLHFAGGPSESYRITVLPTPTSFTLTLPNDRFDIAPGTSAAIPVQVVRKGYPGPIELSIKGLPGLNGKATVKAGQNAAVLLVTAKADVALGAYQFHIIGTAKVEKKTIAQTASAKAAVVQALGGLAYPPMHLPTFVALAVKEKAPFTLAIKMDPPEGIPGGKATVTITATRDEGFDGEITLTPPTGLPATIPAPKTIPAIAKGKNTSTFALDMNPKTPMGEFFVLVNARAKHQGKDFTGSAPPLLLSLGLPFDLKVEPATLMLNPGDKAKIKVTAIRKGGYKGAIVLEFRKLPAGVTAAKAGIPADQTTTEVEITAAATAVPAEASADVSGTASALNNLQNASPPFMLRVQKK